MTSYCPTCGNSDFRVCRKCGAHFLSASPSDLCFDCRKEQP